MSSDWGSDWGDTIHKAAERCDLEAVRHFLEVGGVDVDCTKNGSTPLMEATLAGAYEASVKVISYLISKNANVELTDKDLFGRTPLIVATRRGKVSAVKILLEEGHANVHARDVCGNSAIHHAAVYQAEATVRLLIAHGASVNDRGGSASDTTPLFRAVHFSNVPMLKVLLQHAAPVDDILWEGQSILHLEHDNAEVFGILLDHCRSTMTEAKFSSFLLHANDSGRIALESVRSLEIAKLLIEQPRGRDQELLPACRAQLVRAKRWDDYPRDGSIPKYHATFASLVLSVPCDSVKEPNAQQRQKTTVNDEIAVKLNPMLSSFQWSVAQEAVDVVVDATDCQDYMAYAILGYLSPVDVMKRTIDDRTAHE